MNDKLKKEFIRGGFAVIVAIITTFGGSYFGIYQPKIMELESRNESLEKDNKKLSDQMIELENSQEPSDDSSAIDEMQGTIDDLMKQLSDAEKKNEDLAKERDQLKEDNDRLETENEQLRKQDISNNGSMDTKTDSDHEKKSSNKGENLLTACPPYQTEGYESPDLVTIMGKEYAYGFTFYDTGYALFNLDSSYETLEIDVGHVDGSYMNERTLTIYLGDNPPKIINMTGDMELTHYEVSVSGVTQMKIAMDTGGGWPTYGIVNAKIY